MLKRTGVRQRLNAVMRERDQTTIQNPDRVVELEGEVRRLA